MLSDNAVSQFEIEGSALFFRPLLPLWRSQTALERKDAFPGPSALLTALIMAGRSQPAILMSPVASPNDSAAAPAPILSEMDTRR